MNRYQTTKRETLNMQLHNQLIRQNEITIIQMRQFLIIFLLPYHLALVYRTIFLINFLH